jgi:phasin protein
VEEAKRAEAEQRRAALRDEREKAESVERQERERVETAREAAQSIGNAVRVSAETPLRVAETAREAVQSSVGSVTQLAREAVDFGRFSFVDLSRSVRNASAGMTALVQTNTGLAMRYQAIWREFLQLAQQAGQARTESISRLMSVRTPQQLLDANIDLLKREMQMYFDGQARLSHLSAEAALDAKQRIEDATSALQDGGDARRDKGRQPQRAA